MSSLLPACPLARREHPILFSGPMIQALLAGRKHVTRRLSPLWDKVKAGDRLWVRETHAIIGLDWPRTVRVARAERMPVGKTLADTDGGLDLMVLEDADLAMMPWCEDHIDGERWRPSIFMPRCLCRIILECEEDTRAERLQDITEEESELEGVTLKDAEPFTYHGHTPSRDALVIAFAELWHTLHTKPGERWEDNPIVRRVGRFHVVEGRA